MPGSYSIELGSIHLFQYVVFKFNLKTVDEFLIISKPAVPAYFMVYSQRYWLLVKQENL